MIHQVGNLRSQARVVARHGRQGRLDALFPDLLGALLDALREEAVRVRARLGMRLPRGDDLEERTEVEGIGRGGSRRLAREPAPAGIASTGEKQLAAPVWQAGPAGSTS